MLGKIRLSEFRGLSLPFWMNMNNISQIKSSHIKSNQIVYTHMRDRKRKNGNKGNDDSIIVVIIIMINVVIYIDKKEV